MSSSHQHHLSYIFNSSVRWTRSVIVSVIPRLRDEEGGNASALQNMKDWAAFSYWPWNTCRPRQWCRLRCRGVNETEITHWLQESQEPLYFPSKTLSCPTDNSPTTFHCLRSHFLWMNPCWLHQVFPDISWNQDLASRLHRYITKQRRFFCSTSLGIIIKERNISLCTRC